MKNKYFIAIMGLLIGLLICACQSGDYFGGPLPGIHFRAPLPDNSAQFSFADRFAAELAKRSGFKIVDATQSDNQYIADRNIELRPITDEAIYLVVTVDTKNKNIYIAIQGPDYSSPKALDVSKNAQDIYMEWFPGSHLERYETHPGIGP